MKKIEPVQSVEISGSEISIENSLVQNHSQLNSNQERYEMKFEEIKEELSDGTDSSIEESDFFENIENLANESKYRLDLRSNDIQMKKG